MHQEGQDILNGALSFALKSTMDRGVHIRKQNSLKDPKLGSICHGNEQDAPLASGPSGPALPRTGQGGEIRTWPEEAAGNLFRLSDYLLPPQRVGQTACCGTGGTGRGCDPCTRSKPPSSPGVSRLLVPQGQAQACSSVARLLVLQRHPLAGPSKSQGRARPFPPGLLPSPGLVLRSS